MWLISYFIKQQKIEDIMSKPLTTSQGVPQGCIFGPTLYSTYTKDVAKAADNIMLNSCGPYLHYVASSL